MSSYYPEGVTGHEPKIDPPEPPPEAVRSCYECDTEQDTVPDEPDLDGWHWTCRMCGEKNTIRKDGQ